MKKTYVLDTNVLLADSGALHAFEDNVVIVPMLALEELDNHKNRHDEVGKNARHVIRKLDEFRVSSNGNLVDGIPLANGGKLQVVSSPIDVLQELPQDLKSTKVDNMIIAFMLSLCNHDSSRDVLPVLVTKDINVRIKCDALGVKSEDYKKIRVNRRPDRFYRGVEVMEMSAPLIDEFYKNERLNVSAQNDQLYPNQIVVIKNRDAAGNTYKSAVTKHVYDGDLVPVKKLENVYGLQPRNKEQNFSLDLLLDPEIKMLTLVGPAGTGKTLLALATALEQLQGVGKSKNTYQKLIVTRPVQTVGRDIGYLPGTLEEKMEPWIAPIRDNLNFLMGGGSRKRGSKRSRQQKNNQTMVDDHQPYLSLLQNNGLIEIEAIPYIRGRSIPNAFMIIDEAQNISAHELKTIITRVGDGTKIVMTGDIEQIDNADLDVYTNGLSYAVEKFKSQTIAGHVTLLKGERSELATLASEIL